MKPATFSRDSFPFLAFPSPTWLEDAKVSNISSQIWKRKSINLEIHERLVVLERGEGNKFFPVYILVSLVNETWFQRLIFDLETVDVSTSNFLPQRKERTSKNGEGSNL